VIQRRKVDSLAGRYHHPTRAAALPGDEFPAMKTLKVIILLTTMIAVSAVSIAVQASKASKPMSPRSAVLSLYKQHKKRSPFFQTKSRALVDRYFDKALADLIWHMPNSADEVGPLDGDPLYNAQDMKITNFVIHKPTFIDDNANVIVTFRNFGKRQEIKFLLASRPTGWKITNIKYDDGTDLIGILRSGQ
jgi:hypothetical protein